MEEMLEVRLAEAEGSVQSGVVVWARAIADVVGQAVSIRTDEWTGGVWKMGTIMQDLRYGVRAIRSAPAFSAMAIATLALGIAASTATFSVVYAVLLRDLPFDEPERLVFVWPEVNANTSMVSLADERMPSLERVSGLSSWTLTLTGAGDPRELVGLRVSPGYFDLLGVRPVAGRVFTPQEDLPGAAGVVVLSHPLWVSAFGADPGVVGRTIDLGGADYQSRVVIGVMPAGVESLWARADVWIPMEGDPASTLETDDSWYVNARLARLAPNATLEQANAEVRAYASEVQAVLSNVLSAEDAASATVRPLREYLARDVRQAIWIALAAAILVLLIGCSNVANLLLARGDARARDLAVRAALGAGRARLTRMLLAEAGILGVAGGVTGVVTAFGLVRVMIGQAPESFPGVDTIAINPEVLAYALALTVLSTLAAGLVPALRVGRAKATATLGGGARGAAASTGGRLTAALVGGQIALAVLVTVGSGLMLRSLTTLLAVDPGMDGNGVLAIKPNPPAGRYPDGDAFRAYYTQVSERIAALPEVESIGAIHLLPGTSSNWSFPTFPEGVTIEPGAQTPSVNFRAVRGEYFRTTRIPVVAGRPVSDADRTDTEPVVVVNQAFVDRFWPGESALGRRLSLFSAAGTSYSVAGVVANVHQHGREIEPLPEMYFSHEQVPWNQMSLWMLVRVRSVDPMDAVRSVQEAAWSVDPEVPLAGATDLAEALGQSTRTTRFLTLLLSAFGGLALALCAVGVFGVTAYTSGRRRPEFGVRLALGSSRAEVVRTAVSRSLAPVAAGLIVGLVVAGLGARLLTSVLFGVAPSDPITFVLVTGLLATTAVVASVVPAWRASRVDPVTVLSSD
jgi:predicted permease